MRRQGTFPLGEMAVQPKYLAGLSAELLPSFTSFHVLMAA